VLRAGLGVRRRLQDLAELPMPPDGALWDFVAGLQRTRLAGVLVSSGLADALGENARAPAELARELELDEQVTARVLGAAVAARLLDRDGDGRVRLSRLGGPLRAEHPNSIASWAAYMAAPATGRAYEQLGALLREGPEPSGHRRAYGDSIWEHFDKHGDEGVRFGEAMRQLTSLGAPALARAYPWPRRGVICDVAGGIGTLLAAILGRRPRLRGILVDAPEVLDEADRFLRSRGLADRVERRAGDLFGELDAKADVYVLKWILHDWSDDACRGILSRLRAQMPAGARVVVIDQNLDPGRPNPITPMVDLHMLVECEGGRERSPREVHALMAAAGLRPGRVRRADLHMLVEGVAA
jgi:hypothetical protein